MRAAVKSLALLCTVLALPACSDAPQDAAANNAAVTDVEALPPDESVATSSEELANGANEPNASELGNAE